MKAAGVLPTVLLIAAAGCTSSRSPGVVAASSVPLTSAGTATTASPSPVELSERWWSWAASVPEAQNAISDATGKNCPVGQPTDVWFLAGTSGGSVKRSCTIPAGRPIFFPVVNFVCGVTAKKPVDAELARCRGDFKIVSGVATLDGQPIHLDAVDTPEFTIDLAAGNGVFNTTGKALATSSGLWASISSLGTGTHTLAFSGTAAVKGTEFNTAVTYALSAG